MVPHRGLVPQRCGEGWRGYRRVTAFYLPPSFSYCSSNYSSPPPYDISRCPAEFIYPIITPSCHVSGAVSTELTCSCLSPHRRADSCRHSSPKIACSGIDTEVRPSLKSYTAVRVRKRIYVMLKSNLTFTHTLAPFLLQH